MKREIKRIIAAMLTIVMCTGTALPANAAATSDVTNLGKIVDSYTTQEGTFTLSTASRFFVVSDSEPTGDLLQTVQLVQRQFAADEKPSGTVLDIVWGPEDWAKAGDIVVKLDTASGIGAEGYSINVAGKATVTAADVDGLLYGLNMLHKYFRADGDNTLSGFKVADVPDTKERTVMLDCGRKYYTKNYIVNFIREMSWMGYNTIELHFSEDSGFRMDFWDEAGYQTTDTDGDGYTYNPTNDFSWLCGGVSTSWTIDTWMREPDTEHLSTADIIEICETAKEYHLDIIPSFDTPAHCDYLTWKFQKNYNNNNSYSFMYNGETYYASKVGGCINYTGVKSHSNWYTQWPYFAAIDIKNEVATAFAYALYSDIADFFKEYAGSTKFNIAADEVNLSTGNLNSAYASSFKWSYSNFPAYVNALDDLLNVKGYTTRIFNDFIGTTKTTAFDINDFNEDIEILYWISPFNPTSGATNTGDNQVKPVSYFVNDGRTVYNVMGSSCYYCTRITGSDWTWSNRDARDPDNRQWQVYASNEEDIYNKWYPADISAKGDYDENVADVSEAQLGGGYFCIWHDFQAVNTEVEIWNGAVDKHRPEKTYYLRDRMWSNITKQWNWDAEDSLAFSSFELVRDKFGDFPGAVTYTGDTASAVSMPTSTAPIRAYLADHSALAKALENKLSNVGYTDASYTAYEVAYAQAEAVHARYDATEAEITEAIEALEKATNALGSQFIFACKTKVNGTEKTVTNMSAATVGLKFYIYVPPMTGYEFESVSGATYTALASKDGSGFISGTKSADKDVVIWYTNVPSTTRLEEVIAETPALDQSSYTASSWSAYQTALAAATGFSVDSNTMQSDVDAKVKALTDALTGLVTESTTTKFVDIVKLTPTAHLGKQVGLKITTTPDVTSLEVSGENLTLCTGRVQTLSSGETVKIWLVNFPADETGAFEYTVTATGANDTAREKVSITVN